VIYVLLIAKYLVNLTKDNLPIKKFLFVVIAHISLTLYSQTSMPISVQKAINHELKSWISCLSGCTTSSFHISDTTQMRQANGEEFAELDSFFAIYKPLINFSPDKRYFVDSYSYQLNLERKGDHFAANVEVDQQVFLYDTKNELSYSLFFGGTERWIDEEIWLGNDTLVLAGIEKDEKATRHPIFYIVNISTGEIIQYSCTNLLCIQRIDYGSPRLKKMKIEGL